MINALHSSRNEGTKKLTLDGNQFGWEAIVNMYERECQQISSGNARMIPKLREVHIIRDSWTKLNVSPAKIMQVRFLYLEKCSFIIRHLQQEQVLGELFDYISQNPLMLQRPEPHCSILSRAINFLRKDFSAIIVF